MCGETMLKTFQNQNDYENYDIENYIDDYLIINNYINKLHDSDTLIENNDFDDESSFIGLLKNEFRLYDDEYIIIKIECKYDNYINNKKFIKASNNVPRYKFLKNDLEDLTSLYEKYNYKIDCDGNLYYYDNQSYVLVGNYSYKKGKIK